MMKADIKTYDYTTNVGDYLIIFLAWGIKKFIAKVVQPEPLIVKIQDEGPHVKLRFDSWEFIVLEEDTAEFQADCLNDTNHYLERNSPLISGLRSLGVEDGRLHEMFAKKEEIAIKEKDRTNVN